MGGAEKEGAGGGADKVEVGVYIAGGGGAPPGGGGGGAGENA